MRRGRWTGAVALLLAVSVGFVTSGCFGKFQLTRNLYEVNRSMDEKYSRSALTWVLVIVPVYAVAGILDFVVFNLIEFWSGENPVERTTTKVLESGEHRAVMTIGREAGATVATLELFRNGAPLSALHIRDDGSGPVTALLVEDGAATRRMTSRPGGDGSVSVETVSAAGPETERFPAAAVATWIARISRAAERAASAPGATPVAAPARIAALAG